MTVCDGVSACTENPSPFLSQAVLPSPSPYPTFPSTLLLPLNPLLLFYFLPSSLLPLFPLFSSLLTLPLSYFLPSSLLPLPPPSSHTKCHIECGKNLSSERGE